jgi:hypothetical protein
MGEISAMALIGDDFSASKQISVSDLASAVGRATSAAACQ